MNTEAAIAQSTRYKVSANHLYSEVAEEAVILDINSGVYYGLNEVGVDIWQWLQQPRTELDILELVLNEYEVSSEQALADIQSVLKEMLDNSLIQTVE